MPGISGTKEYLQNVLAIQKMKPIARIPAANELQMGHTMGYICCVPTLCEDSSIIILLLLLPVISVQHLMELEVIVSVSV